MVIGFPGGRNNENNYTPKTVHGCRLEQLLNVSSGNNRSQKEKALWQDATIAHAELSAKGTRLTFRFDIPEGFNESDTEKDDSYHIWRLNLQAELVAGTDLDRNYELPVYATATQSRFLSDMAGAKIA